jgi:hypothetical protein
MKRSSLAEGVLLLRRLARKSLWRAGDCEVCTWATFSSHVCLATLRFDFISEFAVTLIPNCVVILILNCVV